MTQSLRKKVGPHLLRAFSRLETFASKGVARLSVPILTPVRRSDTLSNSVSEWMQKRPADTYWIEFSFVIDSDRKVSSRKFKGAVVAFMKNFTTRFPGAKLASTTQVSPLDLRICFAVDYDHFAGLDDQGLIDELQHHLPDSGVHVYRNVVLEARQNQSSEDVTDVSFTGTRGSVTIGTEEEVTLQDETQERLFKGDLDDLVSPPAPTA